MKWSKHMWNPKKSNGLKSFSPYVFPVKNSYFRSPRPGTISLLKRQQLGDEICYFWMEKGCGLPLDGTGYKKKSDKNPCFRFNWVNRKITPNGLFMGWFIGFYHIICFSLRCNELAMKSVFIEYSIAFLRISHSHRWLFTSHNVGWCTMYRSVWSAPLRPEDENDG